jgi:hypothetical protein
MAQYFKSLLLLVIAVVGVPSTAMDNSTLAEMLATRAKNSVMSSQSTPGIGVQGDTKLRARRGSAIAVNNQEAGCGGIAIGNVRPVLGDHRQHNVTIIVSGNIINSGNDC